MFSNRFRNEHSTTSSTLDPVLLKLPEVAAELATYLALPTSSLPAQVRDLAFKLLNVFTAAAAVRPEAASVTLGEAVSALFGENELASKDQTARWRPFASQFRNALETDGCSFEVRYHVARGSLNDRQVWFQRPQALEAAHES